MRKRSQRLDVRLLNVGFVIREQVGVERIARFGRSRVDVARVSSPVTTVLNEGRSGVDLLAPFLALYHQKNETMQFYLHKNNVTGNRVEDNRSLAIAFNA